MRVGAGRALLTVGASRKEARLDLLPFGGRGEVQGQSRERLTLSERSFAPLTQRMTVMSGRARTRARGRARGRAPSQPAPPPGAAAPPPPGAAAPPPPGAAAPPPPGAAAPPPPGAAAPPPPGAAAPPPPGAAAPPPPGAATATQQTGQIQPGLQPLESPVVKPARRRRPRRTPQPPKELQLGAGLQALSLKGKRGIGAIFQDQVVNTRQYLEHVKDSTTGTQGRVVKLFTNHFRVTSRPELLTYKYNIDYMPEIEDGKVRTDLLCQHKHVIGECHIFDGNSLLLPHKLQKQKTELVSRWGKKIVKVTIEFCSELKPTSLDCLRYYNILFRKILKMMDLKQVGRNYYNENEATEFLNHKLVIWPGYSTSILEYETSITLCADVNHKLLRMQTAYDLIMHVDNKSQRKDAKEISKELVGSIVFTKYNNRTYRVDAINWEETPRSTFKKSGGEEITFVDYYKEQHGLVVTDLTQPLLVSKGKWKKSQQDTPHEPIMLVPELCYLTGLTDEMRKDYRVMRDLAMHTRLDPEKRQHELRRFMNIVQKNKSAQRELQLWDLKFDPNFVSFSGRIMKEVRILQGSRAFNSHPQFADWSKETRSGPLLNVKSLDHWLVLYPRRNYGAALSLLQSLRKVTPTMGIAMRDAKMLEVNDTVQSYTTILENHVSSKTQMVLCVLSSDRKDLYDGIKKYLCVNCPIPSQCVVARTLDKPQTLMTIATKIAQQMNCKMGGALWKVETGLRNAMFVGIDCFHDIVNRRKSIAGFVSSVNQELTQWFSQCVFQEAGQELVSGLKACLEAALKLWYKHNLFLPQSIIVYRDGVGDGQLQALIEHEVPQIRSSLKSVYGDEVRLTVVVVKKRINTRFFAEYQGRLQNPLPGTVIDVEVTKRQWYDFFIVSQSVKDGTVTPTHYNVIHDTVHFTPDGIQCLTYRLCHMYYNLSGVIRVPAPCHYAHKLAYLVGQSIHQEPHYSLASRLFYL
ncbi:piwi-like protein 1 [Panthera pardus]|uniref:Piwi-like protein 1 n=1 Tax=Panthera pardus TaxID=9691 RepID=A0A9W2VJI1_PANPR|nr:piwi-like protein 1 [Panthera pardus]